MRRPKPRRDTTPCTVTVTPGHLVFHDGAQRDGTLHDVPKHLAMHWQKHHFATIVEEPVGAGAASNTEHVDITTVQGAATTAHSLRESDDLRNADTDHTVSGGWPGAAVGAPPAPAPGGKGGGVCPVSTESRAVLGKMVCTGLGISPPAPENPPDSGNPLQDNMIDPSPYRLDASDGLDSGGEARTGSYGLRTGSRACRNCGAPVAGRRKWCSDACRLQAYRHRGGGE